MFPPSTQHSAETEAPHGWFRIQLTQTTETRITQGPSPHNYSVLPSMHLTSYAVSSFTPPHFRLHIPVTTVLHAQSVIVSWNTLYDPGSPRISAKSWVKTSAEHQPQCLAEFRGREAAVQPKPDPARHPPPTKYFWALSLNFEVEVVLVLYSW